MRRLSIGIGIVFIVAALLRLADVLNLVASPPADPGANLVERVLASIPYRHDVWPVFFGTNVLIALGFAGVAALGWLLAARMTAADDRRGLLLGTLVTAGILGTAGQLVLVGAVRASIDIPYCDCGFKDQEVVSQVWAEMVSQGAAEWLVNGALLLAAFGLVIAAARFAGREMPDAWGWLSIGTAVVLGLWLVLSFLDQGDLADPLLLLTIGILVPAWSIWLGLRFGARSDPAPA
ncbi:MAG TPA: hypothetical protein VGI98_06010 [Candidatus Limnocylindrales bacterium]|jgi:hypothetical protein